ncbi:hypothetical protein ACS0TY_029451 [Phlomoides rotata]
METQPEKVYVAIGTEWCDGFSTLQWTLRKWSDHEIKIVILHAPNTICKDYVYTPIGKLRTTSVSEEKLRVLEKTEEASTDMILSKYIAFCGRVEAEVIKLEKSEQPLHKQIVEAISNLRITKLVMSFAFMKSSSWKSKTAISGSFYVLRQKPDFCQVFVICGGRLVLLRGEDEEELVEDDGGSKLARLKDKNYSIKNWLGKMFTESAAYKSPDSPSSSRNNDSPNQWEKCRQEIEHYVDELLSTHQNVGGINGGNAILNGNSTELRVILKTMDAGERIQFLKRRIQDAQDAIELNRKEANIGKERSKKAEWAITICKTRAEELETCLDQEIVKNVNLNKELESREEEIVELQSELEEKRSKLNSILELQGELSNKLHLSSSLKAHAESQLEKAVKTRASMVQDIEELRRHRDVLQRRIEFCKEKDVISKVSKMNGFGFEVREFSAAEMIAATEDFSERLRLKFSCQWKNVYRGRINHLTVAIKIHKLANEKSLHAFTFTNKVKLLSQIRHRNVLAMIGFCSQLNCIVYEYMQNGSLHNALFPTERSCRRQKQSLSWHGRIRIAAEICSAIGFLHKAKPNPIIHGNLKPSKILLDRNNVAKIYGLKGPWSYDKLDISLDVRAFGNLVLQLLSGKNSTITMETRDLDCSAGKWPMDLAMELFGIGNRCVAEESITAMPVREINDVKKRADQLVANGELQFPAEEDISVEEFSNIPSAFLCPIFQDVMHNPHIAADGFSYELEAIDEWLKTGQGTSPMTNLRLKHQILIPNHTLRSLIEDWKNKRSAILT